MRYLVCIPVNALHRACLGIVLALALGSCATSGPLARRPPNRFAAEGQRHGRWQEYFDAEETQVANRGRYRNGRPVGRWRYYATTGQLEHTERFHQRGRGAISLAYYHPNGRLAKRGQARYVSRAGGARFYWQGEWKVYTESGRPAPSEFYEQGHLQTPIRR